MLPKIRNSKDNIGTPGLQVNPQQSMQNIGSMANVMSKIKSASNSKKAIEKTLKKTNQTLSSISSFPAFFDFMRKENSVYHAQMENMEKDLSKRRDVRHKEVMNILISATRNKRVAEKKIVSQSKKAGVEAPGKPGTPSKPEVPAAKPAEATKAGTPAKPAAPTPAAAKPPAQPTPSTPAKPAAPTPTPPAAPKPAAPTPTPPAAPKPAAPTAPAAPKPTAQPTTPAPAQTAVKPAAPSKPATPAPTTVTPKPATTSPKTTPTKVETPTVKPVEPVKPPTAQQVPSQPAVQTPPVKQITPVPKSAAPSTAKRVADTAVAAGTIAASSTALAKIKKHEDFSAIAYPDPEKNPDGTKRKEHYSIGYGHQITEQEIKQGFIQIGNERVPVVGHLGKDTLLTKKQGEDLVAQDFTKYVNAAKAIPNFDKLNQPAQDALIDITYNMGVGWTKKFPTFMKYMSNMEFEKAADQLLYTDATKTKKTGYFTQVNRRAEENANRIRKGATNQAVQLQTPKIEEKIAEGSIQNADMTKDMKASFRRQEIIQQNFHNTTNRQHFVPPAQKQQLNPTMQ